MATSTEVETPKFDVALREAFIAEVELRKATNPGVVYKPLDIAIIHTVLADLWNRNLESEKTVERLASELAYLRKALGEDKGKK